MLIIAFVLAVCTVAFLGIVAIDAGEKFMAGGDCPTCRTDEWVHKLPGGRVRCWMCNTAWSRDDE